MSSTNDLHRYAPWLLAHAVFTSASLQLFLRSFRDIKGLRSIKKKSSSMRFAIFSNILTCLVVTKISHLAMAVDLEKSSSPANIEASNLSMEVEKGSTIDESHKSAWIKVQVFALLNTYANILSRTMVKLDGMVATEPIVKAAIKSPDNPDITKELRYVLKLSRANVKSLHKIESRKFPSGLPKQIPKEADIAKCLFHIGQLFKPFWSKISEIHFLAYKMDWYPKLFVIASSYGDIIKFCCSSIKTVIPDLSKYYLPERNDFVEIGLGLDKVVEILKSLH